MRTIQMQVLLPHLIAISDGEYRVYAAKHIRIIQILHPTQIVYETGLGEMSLWCEEQTLVSMDFETDVNLTEIQHELRAGMQGTIVECHSKGGCL